MSKTRYLNGEMTFWRNVLPNMLLHGQNAVLVVSISPQNFYQCGFFQITNAKDNTPPLWTDLVKILTKKLRHASSFSLECTNCAVILFTISKLREL